MPVQVQGVPFAQKRGGSGCGEEDTSAQMLRKLPRRAARGGMQLLQRDKPEPAASPAELLAFTPTIAACLELLLLRDQND